VYPRNKEKTIHCTSYEINSLEPKTTRK